MMESDSPVPTQRLFICTVGGTVEPVLQSLLHWRPARVLFLPTGKTRATVDTALRTYAEHCGAPLPAGAWEQYVLADEEDFSECVSTMRSALEPEVRRWQDRGGYYRVIVDITAGTKCMTAALALVARRWRCQYSYVGGQQRTKGGVGVVESGAERVVHFANPWDALGYQAVEDAVTVFNHGGYAAAAALLEGAVKNAEKPEVKRELSTLKAVIDAYAAWDRFDHKEASRRFADALKNGNDLAAIFPHDAGALIARLERHRDRVAQLADQKEPATAWVEDLLHNARRRAAECRFDDAVARLYRAIEALGQVRLRDPHGIPKASDVTLEQLPESLRQEWVNRGRDGRHFKLGLQDVYRVLVAFEDPLGKAFEEAGLAADVGSPLVARNNSILAHGFEPVGRGTYGQLEQCLTRLLEQVAVDGLPAGPEDWRLPGPSPEASSTTVC